MVLCQQGNPPIISDDSSRSEARDHAGMAHLPEDDLPSSFDVIVDGTGLVQSILAAALARAGKSVLHIDRNSYYGEHWASLMHRELQQWMTDLGVFVSTSGECADTPPPNEDWITIKDVVPSVANVTQVVPEWAHFIQDQQLLSSPTESVGSPDLGQPPLSSERSNISDQPPDDCLAAISSALEEPSNSETAAVQAACLSARPSWESLDNVKRRLTYDILPKVLYCRGSLVDVLTQSNCGRYIEFKAVRKIFTQVNGELELVPCSRADMFSTKSLSMIDKRKMMRFLTFCAEYESHPEQYQEFENQPFVDYLTKNDLHVNLRQYIIHCIAMVEETTPTIEALKATKLFLISLGRFGNAPFLYPIFGVGELPQAFCRLCAVFGGIYCLRRHIKTFVVSSNSHKVEAVICSTGQRISCTAAVCSAQQLATTFSFNHALNVHKVSRAIYIADGPIKNTQESLALISLPPGTLGTDQSVSIRVLQLDPSTNTAVPGTYMMHAMCPSAGSSAEVDLQRVTSAYFSTPDEFDADKPRLLYALYFTITLSSYSHQPGAVDGLPQNLLLTSDPPPSMAFEGAVSEARELFNQLCPEEEFLPPPPDPEDIVYEDPPSTEGVPGATTPTVHEDPPSTEGTVGATAPTVHEDPPSTEGAVGATTSTPTVHEDPPSTEFEGVPGASTPTVHVHEDPSSTEGVSGGTTPTVHEDPASTEGTVGATSPTVHEDPASTQGTVGATTPTIHEDPLGAPVATTLTPTIPEPGDGIQSAN